MSDQEIEQEIQSKGKTAARVTPDAIEANIAGEHYFTAADGVNGKLSATGLSLSEHADNNPLRLLTFCVLELLNGFTVTGESACASPENFDAEIGRKVARNNAVQKVWPLMGYALKQELHERADVGKTGDATIAPTHRCKVCGALWALHPGSPLGNESWQLRSPKAESCCDNVAMGDQIEAI